MHASASSHTPEGLPPLSGLSPERLAEALAGSGLPRFRARQLATWLYHRGVFDARRMTDLPAELRARLAAADAFRLPAIAELDESRIDDTTKFVLSLSDGKRVEAVRIGMGRHVTLCLSSQAGCGYACVFCATGRLGLLRNLTAAEIVSQVLVIRRESGWADLSHVNVVFMGMGEPLANYPAVLEAIRTLHSPDALGLGARRITVSTVGLVPMVRRLARERLPLGLALSLHATTDALRDKLVPANRKWPLREVLQAVRDYADAVSRRPTLEYVLLAGVNDSAAEGVRLGEIARSLPAKVNVIPYNESAGPDFRRPSENAIRRFREAVARTAPAVTVRKSRGRDILAACGQLGGEPVRPTA